MKKSGLFAVFIISVLFISFIVPLVQAELGQAGSSVTEEWKIKFTCDGYDTPSIFYLSCTNISDDRKCSTIPDSPFGSEYSVSKCSRAISFDLQLTAAKTSSQISNCQSSTLKDSKFPSCDTDVAKVECSEDVLGKYTPTTSATGSVSIAIFGYETSTPAKPFQGSGAGKVPTPTTASSKTISFWSDPIAWLKSNINLNGAAVKEVVISSDTPTIGGEVQRVSSTPYDQMKCSWTARKITPEEPKSASQPAVNANKAESNQMGTLGDMRDSVRQERTYIPKILGGLTPLATLGGKMTLGTMAPKQDTLKTATGKVDLPSPVVTGSGTKVPKTVPRISIPTSGSIVSMAKNFLSNGWNALSSAVRDTSPVTIGNVANIDAKSDTSGAVPASPAIGTVKNGEDIGKPSPTSLGSSGGGIGFPGGSISTPTNINGNSATVLNNTDMDCYFVSADGTRAKTMKPADIVSTDCKINSLAPPGDTSAEVILEDPYGNDLSAFEIPITVQPAISPMTIGMITFAILALLTVSGFFGKAYSKKKKLQRLEKEITQQAARASEFMNATFSGLF